jgi:endonuclease/exonuclease/phosphatase family metal-dependent hydrolase
MDKSARLKRIVDKIDRLVFWANCFFALLLLLSYLSPVINPQNFWPVALLSLGYHILFLVNVFFIVYWIIRLKWYALISAICILAGLKFLMSIYGFHDASPDAPKSSASQIRVLSYNVHDFNISYPDEDVTKPLMLQLIKKQQPDIACFIEYYSWRKQNSYQVTDTLKKIIQTPNYYFEPLNGTTTYDIGLAIFSKYPIIKQERVMPLDTSGYNPGIYCDLKYYNKVIRVYCLHLQSLQFEPKDLAYIESVSSKGKANIHSSIHVLKKLKAAFIKRSEQVAIVKNHASLCPYPYIFCGDFNDTPTSYAVSQMAAGIKNTFTYRGNGFGTTFNGNIPNYQIDYIMASPQFDVMSYKIIQEKLSDHYPLRSDLQLK